MLPNCALSGQFQEASLDVYSLEAGLENAIANFISSGLLSEVVLNPYLLGIQNLVAFCGSAIIYRLCT